jgi:hypothetical protein
MKSLSYYKKMQADAQRAQVKYNRALLALQNEVRLAARRMEQASKAWRTKPSAQNRKKMLLGKKAWAEGVKTLETLLGRLYAG